MKLTGNLKKQVEATATKDEARGAIRKAGMELTDDELDMVAGGEDPASFEVSRLVKCNRCGNMRFQGYDCPFCRVSESASGTHLPILPK